MSTVSRQEKPKKSPVVKRSIVIAGHKTSVSLEDAFWQGLKHIAGQRDLTLSDLVATIDTERRQGGGRLDGWDARRQGPTRRRGGCRLGRRARRRLRLGCLLRCGEDRRG